MSSANALQPLGIRPGSLTDIVFERIHTAITSKAIEPGSRVSESSLAQMLHVSKTPVREALLRLCYVGLVEHTVRGMQVVRPNRTIVQEAYEVRIGLESHAARVAAQRASNLERAAIVEAARGSLDTARQRDSVGFAECDLRFHTGIGRATGNHLLADAVTNAVTLAFTLRTRDVPTYDDSVHCGEQHIEIAEAISAGSGDRAADLMSGHILEVIDFVLSFVPGGSEPDSGRSTSIDGSAHR
jgi:GntR family transcriptional regulator, rspAB operon transcriptional repressor